MKRYLKQSLARFFHLGQRLGFDVLPRHFYSEIPNISKLRSTQAWREPYSMIGCSGADVDDQLRFVEQTATPEIRQRLRSFDIHRHACERNGASGYGPIESQFLYAFVRHHRPARITQVGCGVSTAICLAAAADAGYEAAITCIEPYPTAYLSRLAGEGAIRLVKQPVEDLPFDFLGELQRGDFFFVDSTHTLGPAGEVTRIIVEMLPRLADGVMVHFHDIWFPYDYEPAVLEERLFFWHETALLLAFLTLNSRFHILASLSMLHYKRSQALANVFHEYRPMTSDRGIRSIAGQYPSSIFLTTILADDFVMGDESTAIPTLPRPLPTQGMAPKLNR